MMVLASSCGDTNVDLIELLMLGLNWALTYRVECFSLQIQLSELICEEKKMCINIRTTQKTNVPTEQIGVHNSG